MREQGHHLCFFHKVCSPLPFILGLWTEIQEQKKLEDAVANKEHLSLGLVFQFVKETAYTKMYPLFYVISIKIIHLVYVFQMYATYFAPIYSFAMGDEKYESEPSYLFSLPKPSLPIGSSSVFFKYHVFSMNRVRTKCPQIPNRKNLSFVFYCLEHNLYFAKHCTSLSDVCWTRLKSVSETIRI